MPTNIYQAKDFYNLQKQGKVGKGLKDKEKLVKLNNNFYVYKTKFKGVSNGKRVYKDELNAIKDTTKVYSRGSGSGGVTVYSKSLDLKRMNPPKPEKQKEHSKHPHFSDKLGSYKNTKLVDRY